jgi:hypothetical protein
MGKKARVNYFELFACNMACTLVYAGVRCLEFTGTAWSIKQWAGNGYF